MLFAATMNRLYGDRKAWFVSTLPRRISVLLRTDRL